MDQLLLFALTEAPTVINGLKALFKQQNPGAPDPSSADLVAALNTACALTLVKDDQLRAQLLAEIARGIQ